jgi:hypothetical protein
MSDVGEMVFLPRVLEQLHERTRQPHQRMRARRRRDAERHTDEQRVVERFPHPPQRHADGRLAHAEQPGRAAHAQLVVERERDRQQVQIRRLLGHRQKW